MVETDTPKVFATCPLGIPRSTANSTLILRSFEYAFMPALSHGFNTQASRCQAQPDRDVRPGGTPDQGHEHRHREAGHAGRHAHTRHQALHRRQGRIEPFAFQLDPTLRNFADYAREAAATGVWHGSRLAESGRLG